MQPARTAKRHPWPMRRSCSGFPAVFLDRDGVINEEVSYLDHPDRLKLIDGAAAAIAALKAAGIPVIVITNQSAIARGRLTEKGLVDIHTHLLGLLAEQGASLDAIYYSPFHPDVTGPYAQHTNCRKPGPGMLLAAEDDLSVNLSGSVVVGDKICDLQAGRAVGAKTMLVLTGHGTEQKTRLPDGMADHVVADLAQAVTVLTDIGWVKEARP